MPDDVFSALLDLVKTPDDPKAQALRSKFECASVTSLLLRLMKAEGAEHAKLEREIGEVLAASEK
jgi:hypothetical protein